MSEITLLERPDGVMALREPAVPPPHRLLVLLHGRGGNENSLWEFTIHLPGDYRVLAPRGPYMKSPGEYGWRPTIVGRHASLEDNLQPANSLLARINGWARENGMGEPRFAVLGFSQGAVLVYVLAHLFPQRLTRAVVLSGYPPRGLDLSDAPLKDIPFLISHGTRDDIVPIEISRDARPMLAAAGARVTWIEEDTTHLPGPKVRQAIPEFLQ